MRFDTILRGGRVVTAADVVIADIGITGGRVDALGTDLGAAEQIVDAAGRIVMAGGVDSRVHVSQPSGPGIEMADDFASASAAAACGGNTTVIPFCLPEPWLSLRAAVVACRAWAGGVCRVDYGFHLIVRDTDPATLGQDLPGLLEAGYTSFKVFMTYEGLTLSDCEIPDMMSVARTHGAMVMVHAENGDAIAFLRDRADRDGHTGPVHHATTRPVPVEREAVHRAITLAEIAGVPLTIGHVSNGEALDEIRARRRGARVFAETCPQNLTLTAEDLDRSGFEGARCVCSPPPRTVEEQAACRGGIERGDCELFSLDHCPFRFAETAGKDAPGARQSLRNIPNGIHGIETRLPILFPEGVGKGRISLQGFAAPAATTHARLYGLAPRKGSIAVGADADLALWDPTARRTIPQAELHHGADRTPWEGFEVTGWPVATHLRGRLVARDGALAEETPCGAFLARELPETRM